MSVYELDPLLTDTLVEHHLLQQKIDTQLFRSLVAAGCIVALVPVSGVVAIILSPLAAREFVMALYYKNQAMKLSSSLFPADSQDE